MRFDENLLCNLLEIELISAYLLHGICTIIYYIDIKFSIVYVFYICFGQQLRFYNVWSQAIKRTNKWKVRGKEEVGRGLNSGCTWCFPAWVEERHEELPRENLRVVLPCNLLMK